MENIKSNELRLGNLVNHELFGVVQIYAIYKNSFDISRDGKSKEWFAGLGCKAIPLSEEWLLNFGFLQCRENSAGKTYAIFIDGIRFDDTMIVLWSSTGLFWRKNMVMESVHQVQNLYFGLTGQELELNSEAFLK